MANWSGIAATVQAIFRPSMLQPTLKVGSIAALDFHALKSRGITGVVLDKDNCITRPHEDELVTRLQPAWHELLEAFGAANVLIVSNSAGTRKDSLLLQAEAVSRNLHVPVLVHPTPKPGAACAKQVVAHYRATTTETLSITSPHSAGIVFSPRSRALARSGHPPIRPPHPKLLVIGDRITTDMILAHRISKLKVDTVSVLTTELHAREGLGTILLRSLEKVALWGLERRRRARGGIQATSAEEGSLWTDCIKSEGATVVLPASTPARTKGQDTTPPRPNFRDVLQSPRLALQWLPRPRIDLPRRLAALHAPLTRLTSLWRPHNPMNPLAAPTWTPADKWSALFSRESGMVGAAERLVEGGENTFTKIRQRLVR